MSMLTCSNYLQLLQNRSDFRRAGGKSSKSIQEREPIRFFTKTVPGDEGDTVRGCETQCCHERGYLSAEVLSDTAAKVYDHRHSLMPCQISSAVKSRFGFGVWN